MEKVEAEIIKLSEMASLKIEDLTVALPPFEGSVSSFDQS